MFWRRPKPAMCARLRNRYYPKKSPTGAPDGSLESPCHEQCGCSSYIAFLCAGKKRFFVHIVLAVKRVICTVVVQLLRHTCETLFIIYCNVEFVGGGECSAGLYAPRAPVLKHHITTVTSRTCDTLVHGGCLRSPCWFSVSLVRYQLLQALHLKQRREAMSMRKFDGTGHSLASSQSESSCRGRSGL